MTEIADGNARWRFDLPSGFEEQRAEPPALAAFRARDGRRVVVARMNGNTDRAYSDEKAYLAGIEAGVRRETAGYRRLSARTRKIGASGKLPAFDLWWAAGGAVRGARFVAMRGYAVMIEIECRRPDAAMRRVVETFGPAA